MIAGVTGSVETAVSTGIVGSAGVSDVTLLLQATRIRLTNKNEINDWRLKVSPPEPGCWT